VVVAPVLLQISSHLFLAFNPGVAALMYMAVIGGFFSAVLQPTLNALSLKSSPAKRAGAASATYWLGFDAGMAVGPTLFGFIVDAAGYARSYVIGAGFMVLFLIVALIVLRKAPPMRDIVQPVE